LPLSGVKVIKTTGEGGIGEGLDATQKLSKTRALFLTWAIMGFWHGANWTFVLWGLMHATAIFIERKLNLFNGAKRSYLTILGWGITTLYVMLSWIPFRADNLQVVLGMFGKVINPMSYTFIAMRENVYIVTFLMLVLFLLNYFLQETLKHVWERFPRVMFVFGILKWAIMMILVFTFLRPISQFIYFQF
jgi:hypothetical protein